MLKNWICSLFGAHGAPDHTADRRRVGAHPEIRDQTELRPSPTLASPGCKTTGNCSSIVRTKINDTNSSKKTITYLHLLLLNLIRSD